MSLSITVEVNRRPIATATAMNVSEADNGPSAYVCAGASDANPFTGSPRMTHEFAIDGHVREQSVWRLVETMARRLAEDQERRAPAPPSEGG